MARKGRSDHRPSRPARPAYRIAKATPDEVADAVVFERGLGAGSAHEYESIKEAARRGYAEGQASASGPGTGDEEGAG